MRSVRQARWLSIWMVLFLTFFPLSLFAQSGVDHISPEQRAELFREGKVFARPGKDRKLSLAPPAWEDSFDQDLKTIRPNVISEVLLWVDSEKEGQEEDLLFILNELMKVDRLDEVLFDNPEHINLHPIFTDSYRVSGPDSQEPLENLQVDSIPRKIEFPVYQELPPVGPMTSLYTFRQRGDVLEMKARNVTPLKVSFFNVIGKGKFYTRIIILPQDEGFLVYGVGAVNVFNPFNILKGKIEPFYYRIYGLFDWYQDEVLSHLDEDGS